MIRRYTSGRVHFRVDSEARPMIVRATAPTGSPAELDASEYTGAPWTGHYDGYSDLGAWLCSGLLSVYPRLAEQASYDDAAERFNISAGGVLEQRLTARKAAP